MRSKLVERELTDGGPSSRAPLPGGRSVAVNLGESPLAWLFARGHLSARQYDAGESLRADWEFAGLSPGMTMRWDPVRSRSSGDRGLNASERQIAAKARFDGAIAKAGSGLSDILWRTVCAARRWRTRNARCRGHRAAASWF